ncbi:hypothetical protein SAMN05421786_1158 [Chryseobacterium ureilyticum]|uniref:Uncharacterized protein n=1 Tax=Chryseobacterium ureilyticum TaxID=373668 RepID=A0A1N7QRG5_9FLAO|nr:hypothetical protein [Chryseobacterium ureilyticum]SIT25463.1 hypothetical protein SAMN05421786_1158 [Chryseobacterium ureilyticum]
MRKAISSTDLLAKKYDLIEWEGGWYDNFSEPEASGSWFISGHSGNGKTSFMLELAKALSKFDRVLFNSLEEGTSRTMQQAWKRHNVSDCGRSIQLIKEKYEDLKIRLNKRKSPRFIITDSWQYTGMTFEQYLDLKETFPDKLFIWNSQMDGNKPLGKTAIRIQYDADLKIWVEGFKAFSKGRYLGKYYADGLTIWEEGAQKYWSQTG